MIVLLNTIKKIIKTTTAEQIQRITKKHNMLSIYQMGARQDQLIKIALDLLVNQVHEIWRDEDYMALLLFLDITGVYD